MKPNRCLALNAWKETAAAIEQRGLSPAIGPCPHRRAAAIGARASDMTHAWDNWVFAFLLGGALVPFLQFIGWL